MRLTDKGIRALKPKSERYEVWEDARTGLGVRISTTGRKSWVFMYRFEGRPRRLTLGTFPRMGLAAARLEHAKAKHALEKGSDPGTKRVVQNQADRKTETVTQLAEEYLEKWARPRKRTVCAYEDERILNKDVLPQWGRRKARDITRRDVVGLLDGIVERGAPIQANRTLAVIRKMFNFAVSRDVLDASPVAMVQAPARENKRDRVLTNHEIRQFWYGLDRAPMSKHTRLALKLQLVTAQRKGEIVAAPFHEFDLDEGVWTIAALRAKNGESHRVLLSDLAITLLRQTGAFDNCGLEWLFPSPRGGKPMAPEAVDHALRKSLSTLGLDNVTPHDLRRTAASNMTSMGIPRLTVSKILNHVETSVTAVYDWHSYDQEKRQALNAWAARLQEIVVNG